MGFESINPRGIHWDVNNQIPSLIERVKRDSKVGNQIILISGLAQTGKSNCGLVLAHKFSKDPIITFKMKEFFDIAQDTSKKELTIFYDEVQQDIKGWWDILYKMCKQFLESFGYLRHKLIIITPQSKNLMRIRNLVHFLTITERLYNSFEKKHVYYAHNFCRIQTFIEEPKFEEFEIMNIPKIPDKIWQPYMKKKESNYQDRVKDWIKDIQFEEDKRKFNRESYEKMMKMSKEMDLNG